MNQEVADKILSLPDEGKVTHREYVWQGDWENIEICTYRDLKELALLWIEQQNLERIREEEEDDGR
jgi:hypothetical protein